METENNIGWGHMVFQGLNYSVILGQQNVRVRDQRHVDVVFKENASLRSLIKITTSCNVFLFSVSLG